MIVFRLVCVKTVHTHRTVILGRARPIAEPKAAESAAPSPLVAAYAATLSGVGAVHAMAFTALPTSAPKPTRKNVAQSPSSECVTRRSSGGALAAAAARRPARRARMHRPPTATTPYAAAAADHSEAKRSPPGLHAGASVTPWNCSAEKPANTPTRARGTEPSATACENSADSVCAAPHAHSSSAITEDTLPPSPKKGGGFPPRCCASARRAAMNSSTPAAASPPRNCKGGMRNANWELSEGHARQAPCAGKKPRAQPLQAAPV